MSVWQRIFRWLSAQSPPIDAPNPRHSTFEQAPQGDWAELLLVDNALVQAWETLTPREREITALTCLGYTNGQMAIKLGISVETVKTHVANTLRKFNLRSKADLRVALANWQFDD